MADTSSAWAPTVTPTRSANLVTDPDLISRLNSAVAAQPAPNLVTDPALIARLNSAAEAQRPPQRIIAPTGEIIHFPDDTPDSVILDVMRREYGGPRAQRSTTLVSDPALVARLDEAARQPPPALTPREWLFGGPELDDRRRLEIDQERSRRASDPDFIKLQPGSIMPAIAGRVQETNDLVRGVVRGATLNHAEEIVAWLRSKFGDEAYDAALADERRQDQEARSRTGIVGNIASEAVGSLALPMGLAMRGYRALAPAGSGAMRRGAALATTAVPLNTATVYGDMEHKDLGTAAVVGTAASAAFAPVAATAIASGRIAGRVGSDVFSRLAEWVNLRAGRAVQPNSYTQRFATRTIANAAEEGGTRTPADLDAAMRANEVPHTDMALVNSSNDRVSQLALEQARMLHRPNVPQSIPGGRVVNDNIFENLQHNQATNSVGLPQHTALAERVQRDFHIPLWDRADVRAQGHINDEIDRLGRRIQDLRTPVGGQAVADTSLPGFVDLMDSSPEAGRIYRRAVETATIPGSPTSIPQNLVPLHGRDFQQASAAWEARRAAALSAGRPFSEPPPVRLTDQNVPVTILEEMMGVASSRSASETEQQRRAGIALHRALTQLTESPQAGQLATELRNARRAIGIERTKLEDITAGRRMPRQDPIALSAALAEHPTLGNSPAELARRQTARRRGYVQGLVDEINANTDNIGSIPGRVLTDPLRRQAHDVVGRAGTAAPSAEALARELSSVGRMQDTSAGLLHASRNRRTGGSLPEQVARAYAGWNFSPTVGVTRAVVTWLGGMTQARRGEIARLLVDTTGEGRDLLERELTRRMGGYSRMNADNRRAIVLELARQLSEGSAEVLGVGRN